LTLDDTVEFFNRILGVQLTPQEKRDLVAFLRALSTSRCSRAESVPPFAPSAGQE